MNKRGEITLQTVIGLVLVVIFFVIFGGCISKLYAFQECPGGYDLIKDFSVNAQLETFCRTTESVDNVVCCMRISDVNQIIRYDYKTKEAVNSINLAGFHENYKSSFTCKGEVPCGTVGKGGKNQNCAGVFCPENEICLIDVMGGKKEGECVNEFILNEKQVQAYSDGVTPCGKMAGPELVGTACSEREKELGKTHCVIDKSTSKTYFGCRGAI